MQKRKFELAVLIVAAGLGLSACGGGSSNVQPDNKDVVKKTEGGKKDENTPSPTVELLKKLDKAQSKSGDFITDGHKVDLNDPMIVRLENTTNKGTKIDFGKGDAEYNSAGKRAVYGLNALFYNENGKLVGVTPGDGKFIVGNANYNNIFQYKKDGKRGELLKLDGKTSDARIIDAGLKKGGQFAGIYAGYYQEQKFTFRDPAVAGWDYQTFGAFVQGSTRTSGLSAVHQGYQSIGTVTPADKLPTTKSAKYTGISTGHYSVKGKAEYFQTTANVELNVNFANREVDFKTTGTEKYKIESTTKLGNAVSASDLDLSGKAKFDAGKSRFVIKDLKTQEGGLTGQSQGRFYGDQAQEVGGVFGLKTGEKDKETTYVGGFGARR